MSVDINNIAILNIHVVVFRCSIFRINENEAIHILKSSDLSEKGGSL